MLQDLNVKQTEIVVYQPTQLPAEDRQLLIECLQMMDEILSKLHQVMEIVDAPLFKENGDEWLSKDKAKQ